ncbi:MAG: serine/threonine protein kinase [Planctomycetes bacterium]|nr:serine/threonine protein kinase [Planctomycetota bacterium]
MEAESRGQSAEELFKDAVEREAADRAAFLDRACMGDSALRAEVESLLATDGELGSFLESPIESVASALEDATDAMVGTRIGHYRILRIIGSGGMGTVYEAEQDRPKRRVALKLLKSGLASRSAMRRFVHEAEILARLRHPGIAQVYEAGSHGEGGKTPYFAMEYIPGAQPITTYASDHRFSTRQKLDMFVAVCEAVHHGHQRGVIHRDLKPGNILVDESGQPKVIDFGVARSTDADMTIATLRTDVGQLVGTLRYMSPEQCEGDASELDTRSDVYALGVVLFELLTGELPYDLTTTSPFEVPRVIRETAPRRLSSINRSLRGDLETIVLMALAKERDRRYQSALELGQDIRRYMANEPIEAKRDRALYVLKKTVIRHKVAVAVAGLIGILLAGSAIGFGLLYRRAEQQRTVAEDRTEDLRRAAYFNSITVAAKALEDEDTATAARFLDPCSAELRDWEWYYLRRLSDNSLMTLRGHTNEAAPIFSPDGSLIASASLDTTVRLWDPVKGAMLRVFASPADRYVDRVSFSPDGRTLASCEHGTVRLWDVATGRQLHAITTNLGWTSTALSPDGRLLAYGADRTLIKLWDVGAAREIATLRGHTRQATGIAWSPDGKRLASSSQDATIKLWNVESGDEIRTLRGHTYYVGPVAFSPDGLTLASSGRAPDSTIRFWDTQTGQPIQVRDFGTRTVGDIAFSPEGQRFAASVGQLVKVWDLRNWQEEAVRTGVHSYARIDFASDGNHIVGAGISGEIKIWDGNPLEEPPTLRGHTDEVRDVVVSANGRRIYSASSDHTIRVWDAGTRREVATWSAHQETVCTLAVSPDGSRLASGGRDHMLRIWDTAGGQVIHEIKAFEDWNTGAVAFSPDGRTVASGGREGVIKLWSTEAAELLRTMPGRPESVEHIKFSPDGKRLLSSGIDASVWVWDLASGDALLELAGHTGSRWGVVNAVFSPDGAIIATADGSETARVWRAASGTLLHELPGHYRSVLGLAFSPDGRRLATGDAGHLVRLWDVDTGKLVLTLRGHEGTVTAIAFSPDGNWFVTASNDGTLRLWDASYPAN